MKTLVLISALFATSTWDDSELLKARDRQDRSTLEKMAGELRAAAEKDPKDAVAQYRLALAESYTAEVAIETRDKAAAKNAAEAGIDAAERAVAQKPDSPEYQRILGTLCGQIISGNGMAALKYGKCALTAVNKAIDLDPKSSMAYVSHGVGNYYLPAAFGGGMDLAIKDFRKAIEPHSKNSDAWLWLGVAPRRSNQPAEAQKAFEKCLELNP